jgi:hypothetical protein
LERVPWLEWLEEDQFCNERECDIDDLVGAQQWTLNNISERMAEQVVISKYGAYLADDAMKYYLVQCTLDPWVVKDGPLETDGGVAKEGEWVCKGLRLSNVNRAPCWFWLSDKEVVACCQFVLCPNLDLQEISAKNNLPRMNAHYQESILALNPICLSDENHDILMDAASLREGLDYEEEIPDSTSETSTSNKDMEEEDNTDSDSGELDDEE